MEEALFLWDNREKAKETALQYISRQLRTEYETREYLQKKGFAEEDTQYAVAFLKEYGYLDDERYCKSWIRDRMSFHPCGRMKMEQELKKKIGDQSLIRNCLREVFSEEAEEELARIAALQKLQSTRKIKKEQLLRFLMGRGYSYSVVYRVLQDENVTALLHESCENNYDDGSFANDFFE